MAATIQTLSRRVLAALAVALPSASLLPAVMGATTLLTLAPVDRAMADTVCFKTDTELDFINQPTMQNSRDKLENTNYFGPGGAVAPETLDFAAIDTVTESALAGADCDIFIGGGFNGSLTAAEGAQLVDWSQGPRDVVVIGGCDLDTSNQTCLAFGRTLTDIANGGVQLNEALAYNPLTCGGADAVATFGGRSTYLGLGPSGTDVTLASHNTGGREPAATTDSLTNPSFLMTADADMFGSSGSGPIGPGPIASSNQALFVLNVFKFALDGIHRRLDNPQCVASYEEQADLEIALSDPAPYVGMGERIVMTVQVANVSGFAVDDVAATVAIPAGFTLVSATGVGAYDAGSGRWSLGTLAVGDVPTLTLTLDATAPGSAEFLAEIVSSSLTDPDSATNSSFGDDDLNDGLNDDDEARASTRIGFYDRSDGPAGEGALHEIGGGLFLGGGLPDGDGPAASDAAATGDDLSGADDEDGVLFPALVPGESGTVTVTVTGSGYLQAWIDFDGNGFFGGTEQIAFDIVDRDGDGTITLPVSVPPNATTARTYARFRWSTDFGIGAEGYAPDGEVEDHAVTFGTAGPVLSGRIFLDNGAGDATAHDTLMQGAENGTTAATVTLRDAGGAVLASPSIGANGIWSHALSPAQSGAVTVTVAPMALIVTGERTTGLPGLSNAQPRDGTFTFTPTPGQNYDTLDIGLIAPPRLGADNTAAIAPGGTALLRHRYDATTAGTVTFDYVDAIMVPEGGFSGGLFLDVDCDGDADAPSGGATTVSAGQAICLVSRIVASSGAPPGARMTYTLRARTALSTLALTLDATDEDALSVVDGGEVALAKTVRNVTAGSGEGASNAGDLGDVLEYRITVRNPSAETVTGIVVQDTTPVYTRLAEAVPSPVALSPDVTCTVTAPASNAPGYAGPIRWSCAGGLRPGSDGAVSFRVRIEP